MGEPLDYWSWATGLTVDDLATVHGEHNDGEDLEGALMTPPERPSAL
ncbi:MAG: hypothetical protein WEF28_02890 [Acidimicrobiia bacterium]